MDRDRAATLDDIIDSLPDIGLLAVDGEWRLTLMNALAEKYSGVDSASLIGKDYWSAFPDVVGSPFEEPTRRAMRERVPTSAEHLYRSTGRWFSVSVRPLAHGGLAIYFVDTTDRHGAEDEKLRLTRERDQLLSRLQAQFEHMPLACIVSDQQLRIVDWNPAAERVFGYPRDEVLGQDIFQLLDSPPAPVSRDQIARRVHEGNVSHPMIDQNVTKAGRFILCQWHSTPLFDSDGNMCAILAMAEDITARVEAEQRLRESESMLTEAQRIARIGSWSWDVATANMTWSDEHYRLLGLQPGSGATLERFADHIHPDDLPRMQSCVDRAIKDRVPFNLSWRAIREDGETRVMNSTGHVDLDASGRVARLFGTLQDVTEHEVLLASERRAREDAERAAHLKDEFLATLSHELRTPLSAIISWADLLKLAPMDTARVARGLEIITRNARTQAQLVGDLLDLSRIASGKLRLDVQRCSLPDIVRAAGDAMQPAAAARGVQLKLVIESINEIVHGDPSRLQQVVWNLISNAVKFTPQGGHVQVVLARVNSHLEVSVSDDGKGIDPAFLPQVFGRFRQADASAAREHGGLGIGLALVRELVDLHGGTVSAHSDGVDRGSTFVVRLPIAILASDDGAVRLHPRVPAALSLLDVSIPQLKGVRVLVVDDEPDGLEVIRQLLSDQQADVTAVRNVDDALGILDTQSFDVLLSDIGMPRRDGYELIAEIRRRGLKMPAAAITAFARSEDRTRALLSGYQAHLAKPLEVSELVATVASLLGRLGH